jgi:ABC-type polysaccharide/polyol phosphate transport system ATPase subunit
MRLSMYPAVALVGPRQSGKTTLAHSFGGIYFGGDGCIARTVRLRVLIG